MIPKEAAGEKDFDIPRGPTGSHVDTVQQLLGVRRCHVEVRRAIPSEWDLHIPCADASTWVVSKNVRIANILSTVDRELRARSVRKKTAVSGTSDDDR